jgi:hypothetical protein
MLYLFIYLLTYLLTPRSRVLLEKLTGLQLVEKFPAFYGTPRFITAFTFARHLSLFWANSIESIPPHPTSWRSIFMSPFPWLGRTKVSIQVRGKCSGFVTKPFFTVRSCQHLVQPPSWRTTPCWLSATAYSIYSQLPSILEAVPPSATWRRAIPWWQGPTHHGFHMLYDWKNLQVC